MKKYAEKEYTNYSRVSGHATFGKLNNKRCGFVTRVKSLQRFYFIKHNYLVTCYDTKIYTVIIQHHRQSLARWDTQWDTVMLVTTFLRCYTNSVTNILSSVTDIWNLLPTLTVSKINNVLYAQNIEFFQFHCELDSKAWLKLSHSIILQREG